MSRLYILCVIVLIVYGGVVGCDRLEHREARIEESEVVSRGRRAVMRSFICACGSRRPYAELWT